jgi:hypothetical protein
MMKFCLCILILLLQFLLPLHAVQRSPCTALSTSVHKSLRSPYNCEMECQMVDNQHVTRQVKQMTSAAHAKVGAATQWGPTFTKPLKPCRQQVQIRLSNSVDRLWFVSTAALSQPQQPKQSDMQRNEVGQRLSTCANTLTFSAPGVSSAARWLDSLQRIA